MSITDPSEPRQGTPQSENLAAMAEATQQNETVERFLQNARAGSLSSLGQLLQSHRDYLLVVADDELGSDLKVKVSASDVIQDSFLEAQRDFPQFQGTTAIEFQRWLRRLVLNNVANVVRGFRCTSQRDIARETWLSLQGVVAEAGRGSRRDSSASSIVLRKELVDAVQVAIRKLPDHYEKVIRWRNEDRISFEEIGRRLGRSAGAAQQLWLRALEVLQHELDDINDSGTLRP